MFEALLTTLLLVIEVKHQFSDVRGIIMLVVKI